VKVFVFWLGGGLAHIIASLKNTFKTFQNLGQEVDCFSDFVCWSHRFILTLEVYIGDMFFFQMGLFKKDSFFLKRPLKLKVESLIIDSHPPEMSSMMVHGLLVG